MLTGKNCNAGFLVPPVQRGKKIGGALAESFLHYAPRLGYRSSVFNLVFESEPARTAHADDRQRCIPALVGQARLPACRPHPQGWTFEDRTERCRGVRRRRGRLQELRVIYRAVLRGSLCASGVGASLSSGTKTFLW